MKLLIYYVNVIRMFQNKQLRILQHKGEEETEGWRKLHNEELHNLYSSPIIRLTKSRRTR
jgi:hypothetical protein